MIESHQLRIGNLILDEDGGIMPIVSIITAPFTKLPIPIDYPCVFHQGSLYSSCSSLRGIAITPEWLEKCGFEKTFDCTDGRKEYSKKGSKMILYYSKHNTIEGVSESTYSTKLKFVHELQNLHHALTGNELEINLPEI